jgi:hypothetical protein
VAIVMFRETPLRQVGSSPRKLTRQVSILATRSQVLSFASLAQADAFAAVGSPAQRLNQHHGIVMDRARCNLEQSDLKDPVELVIAA